MNELISTGYFPRIHTALAEWLMCLCFLWPMKPKAVKTRQIVVSLAFGALLLGTFILMEREQMQGLRWMLAMLAAMTEMLLLLYLTGEGGWSKALYDWARAFSLAELAASLEWQLNHYLVRGGVISAVWQTYFCMSAVYLAAAGLVLLHRRSTSGTAEGRVTWREALGAAGIALGAFAISNLQFALPESDFTKTLGGGVLYARTLVDLSGVIMLYASSEQRRELALRYELDATRSLLRRQYEQYQQFEANNEAMHRVYHDLKHQIAYLESESSLEKRMESLQEMKEIIRVSESRVDTGNTALDTLLTSKSLICAGEGITMTCYADANLLDFMDVMDVCCIFGNTIDNAIEHTRKERDPEDRVIRIQVTSKGAFLVIRIENCCTSPVEFVGGAPVTTKEDKHMHGYGIKSVRRTAEKYGGHLQVEQVKDWFIMTALIPLPSGGKP